MKVGRERIWFSLVFPKDVGYNLLALRTAFHWRINFNDFKSPFGDFFVKWVDLSEYKSDINWHHFEIARKRDIYFVFNRFLKMDSVLQPAIYRLLACGVSVSISSNKIAVQGSNFVLFCCVPYISHWYPYQVMNSSNFFFFFFCMWPYFGINIFLLTIAERFSTKPLRTCYSCWK